MTEYKKFRCLFCGLLREVGDEHMYWCGMGLLDPETKETP